jgi:hypothetical protein
MKLANVAGSNQPDPELCVYRHSDFPSKLVGITIDLFQLSERSSRAFAASELNYETSVRGPSVALEDCVFCSSTDLHTERWIFGEA